MYTKTQIICIPVVGCYSYISPPCHHALHFQLLVSRRISKAEFQSVNKRAYIHVRSVAIEYYCIKKAKWYFLQTPRYVTKIHHTNFQDNNACYFNLSFYLYLAYSSEICIILFSYFAFTFSVIYKQPDIRIISICLRQDTSPIYVTISYKLIMCDMHWLMGPCWPL